MAASAWAQPIGGMFGGSCSNRRFHFRFESIDWIRIVDPAASEKGVTEFSVTPFSFRRNPISICHVALMAEPPARTCNVAIELAVSRRLDTQVD
jgi:hypothetical protein